jgi:hypothetical protein
VYGALSSRTPAEQWRVILGVIQGHANVFYIMKKFFCASAASPGRPTLAAAPT